MKLILIFILMLSSFVHASNLSISRVDKPSLIVLKSDAQRFAIIREVCTDEDLYLKVYKKFVNRNTGEIYSSPYPSEYEYQKNTCSSRIYTVPIDVSLPRGAYDYKPRIYYKTKTKSGTGDAPNEIFILE